MIKYCFVFIILIFNLNYAQTDSSFTIEINSQKISLNVPLDIYINLNDFQKFIQIHSATRSFKEMLTLDLTGDGINDTLVNNIYLNGNDCEIISYISSKSILYSDSLIIQAEYGNYENVWGSDEVYTKLLPYSNLYNGYLNRLESYNLPKENIEDKLNQYLMSETERMKTNGLTETQIRIKQIEIKKYVDNYKGKFIHNLSLSDYDTYIYFPENNKFEKFYSP